MAMLKKEQCVPGVKLHLRTDRPLDNGLGGVLNMMVPGAAKTWTTQVSEIYLRDIAAGKVTPVQFNTDYEVVKGVHSKRIGLVDERAKVIEVRDPSGKTGVVFWCEARANFEV